MKACLCTLPKSACKNCPNNQDGFNELGSFDPNFRPPYHYQDSVFKFNFTDPLEVLNKYAKLLKDFEDKQLDEKIKKEVEKQLSGLKVDEKKEEETEGKSCWNCIGSNGGYNTKHYLYCKRTGIQFNNLKRLSLFDFLQSISCNRWKEE